MYRVLRPEESIDVEAEDEFQAVRKAFETFRFEDIADDLIAQELSKGTQKMADENQQLQSTGDTSEQIASDGLKRLQKIIAMQSSTGNYDWDPYMHGMANGLILAKAILTDEEPKYLDAPKQWLSERSR
jgi:hypothetical protein